MATMSGGMLGGPAFFTRGSGHNEKALYSERADDYTHNLDRLSKKFDTARSLVPKPEVDMAGRGGIGITLVLPDQQADVSRVARLQGHVEKFEETGMQVAKPRVVYTSRRRGGRSKW